MSKSRLEAFSDGVLAIIITIMVLELHIPQGSGIEALRPVLPILLSYLLSFVYIGIYWNNHHHLLHATRQVRESVLWANLHLLFWLSLLPFATGWMGASRFAPDPTAVYGMVLLMSGVSYWILVQTIIAGEGENSLVRKAIGKDRKGFVSVVMYAIAIPFGFVAHWVAHSIYILVALLWLIPDRRIERLITSE
ncbi:TMEM175 family protein [Occallatibacter savannae]|uniref:TMEM175 family protein n=1 Tax=Occallatibacter savannae TaxID=1002691 RepID=UPI000D692284|nr:TMEM175 family protein [Occallatibacter savannae]